MKFIPASCATFPCPSSPGSYTVLCALVVVLQFVGGGVRGVLEVLDMLKLLQPSRRRKFHLGALQQALLPPVVLQLHVQHGIGAPIERVDTGTGLEPARPSPHEIGS